VTSKAANPIFTMVTEVLKQTFGMWYNTMVCFNIDTIIHGINYNCNNIIIIVIYIYNITNIINSIFNKRSYSTYSVNKTFAVSIGVSFSSVTLPSTPFYRYIIIYWQVLQFSHVVILISRYSVLFWNILMALPR
jgi:hypothetical protein